MNVSGAGILDFSPLIGQVVCSVETAFFSGIFLAEASLRPAGGQFLAKDVSPVVVTTMAGHVFVLSW